MLLVIVYVGAVAILFLFVVMMMNITAHDQRSFFSKVRSTRAVKTFGEFLGYGIVFLFVASLLVSIAPIADQGGLLQKVTSLTQIWPLFLKSKWFIFSPQASLVTIIGSVLLTWFVARGMAQFLLKKSFLSITAGFVDSLAFMILVGAAFVFIFVYFAINWLASPLSEDLVASPIPPPDLMTNTHALGQVIYRDYIFAFQAVGIILLVAMVGAIVLTLRKREGVKKQIIRDQLQRRPEETLVIHKVPLGKGVG